MIASSHADWSKVRGRLTLMSVLDPLRWRFGASEHRYRLNPGISEQELASFEAEQQVALPADYRSFLLEVGNGGAGPHYGLLPLGRSLGPGDLSRPFPLTEAYSPVPDDNDDIPSCYLDGHLRLSPMGCGYWSILIVTGPAAGTVWDDFLAGDGGYRPTGHSFATWYNAWLWPRQKTPVSDLRSKA